MGNVSAIGALIAEVQAAHVEATGTELTYGDIARRSREGAGPGLSRGRIQQIARDPIKAMPNRLTVRRLARGLRVPESVVIERYMRTVGLPGVSYDVVDEARGDPTIEAILTERGLSPEGIREVMGAYAKARERQRGGGTSGTRVADVDRPAVQGP